jgi:hypothetical protein
MRIDDQSGQGGHYVGVSQSPPMLNGKSQTAGW